MARLDQPPVDGRVVAHRDMHHLGAAGDDLPHLGLLGGVVVEHADHFVVRQADQVGLARRIESRHAVESPVAIRRDVVSVRPRLVLGSHAFRLRSVQTGAIEVPLRPIFRRCDVIQPAARLIHRRYRDHIEGRASHQPRVAFAGDGIDVPPAVALAGEQQPLAVFDPFEIAVHFHPSVVLVLEHLPQIAGFRVRDVDRVGILQPVHVLQNHLVVLQPLHVRDVGAARVARRLEPDCLATGGGDHAHPHGRVHLARLGIFVFGDHRVQLIGVVDEREILHAALVELVIGDLLSVGAPQEAIGQAELFVVVPIGSAVDDVVAGIEGKLLDGPGMHVLYIEIPARLRSRRLVQVAQVGYALAIRRELREHQPRGRLASEFAPGMVGLIQQPIVAGGLADHHRVPVRAEQQLGAVGRCARRHRPAAPGRSVGRPRAGSRIDAHGLGTAAARRLGRGVGLTSIHPPSRPATAPAAPSSAAATAAHAEFPGIHAAHPILQALRQLRPRRERAQQAGQQECGVHHRASQECSCHAIPLSLRNVNEFNRSRATPSTHGAPTPW